MQIPSYQIRNILSSYVNLLTRESDAVSPEKRNISVYTEKYGISAEGKRRSVIEKVVDEIIGKITDVDAANPLIRYSSGVSKSKREKQTVYVQLEFEYYKIENGGEKRKFHFRPENVKKPATGIFI